MRSATTHALSFGAGALFACVLAVVVLSSREPVATVVLINESGAPLTDVRVTNNATGGTLIVDRIEVRQSETLRLYVRGENSYVVSAILPGAGQVEVERYMEAGYLIREHIGSSEIRSEFSHD